jgi:hypothetical protein
VARSFQHWTPVLRDHWSTAQGQWAVAYDNLPPIVYISSGFAPNSERPEEGGQRDLTTDITASSERIAYITKFTSKYWYSSQPLFHHPTDTISRGRV